MLHILREWLRHPAVHSALVSTLGAAYLVGAVVRWRRGTGWHRLFYAASGILLATYEVHMMWWWLVTGFAALGVATRDWWWRRADPATAKTTHGLE